MSIRLLKDITWLSSGIYMKPHPNADVYYLQSTNFLNYTTLNPLTSYQLSSEKINQKHFLQEGDLLFTAKGIKNYAVVYKTSHGKAVASSSFIVIRIKESYQTSVLPNYLAWYINQTKKVYLMHQQQLGSTIPSISIKQLENIEIEIPDLHTQDLIVRIQNLEDRRKELLKQLQKQKDLFFQTQLIKAINGK